jgi:hypothetical protein
MEIIPVEVAKFDSLATVPTAPEEQPEVEAAPTPPPEAPKEERKEIPNIVKKIATKPAKEKQTAPLPPPPSAPAGRPSDAGTDTFGVTPGIEAEPVEQVRPEIPESLRNHQYKAYVRLRVEVQANGSATPFYHQSRFGGGTFKTPRFASRELQDPGRSVFHPREHERLAQTRIIAHVRQCFKTT